VRIVLVTGVFIFLMFTATVAWYSLTPVFYNVTAIVNSTAYGMGLHSSVEVEIGRVVTILRYLFPILMGMIIIGIIVWLYTQMQRVDYESVEYY